MKNSHKHFLAGFFAVTFALIFGLVVYPNVVLQKGETTVPEIPTDLAGTPGDGQIALTWTAPADGGSAITSYTINYIVDKAPNSVSTESSETSYTLTGLTNDKLYTISIAAENSVGLGEYSGTIEATPTAEGGGASVPSAPTDLTGTPGDGQIALTWTAADNNGAEITNHRVSYTPAGGEATEISTSSSKSNYIIEGLENGITYTVRVLAVNSEGNGEYSEGIEATPEASATAPGAPTRLSGTAGDTQVSLSWTAPVDNGGSAITGYRIGYTKSGGSEANVNTNSTETSYTLTGLTNDIEYTIVVYAINSVGVSSASTAVVKTPNDGSGPVISSLVVTTTDTTATFTWGTSKSASSQVRYALTSSIDSDGKQSSEINTTPLVTGHTLTLTGLKSCSVYKYKAVSKDASLNVGQSDSSTFATKGCPGEVAPDPEKSVASKITVASGGSVTATDGDKNIEVEVPAGASDEDEVFIQTNILDKTIAQVALSLPTGKSKWLGSAAQINAMIDATTPKTDPFSEPVEVTLTYTDDELNGTDESTLKIYRHDGTSWYQLDNCSVDTVNNVVTCYTTKFSTFGIFGEEGSGDEDSGSGGSSGSSIISTGSTPKNDSIEVISEIEDVTGDTSDVVLEDSLNNEDMVQDEKENYNFTKYLWFGLVDEEVRMLQRVLNRLGFNLAVEGPGSPGNETNYFGSRTKNALIKFQEAHADRILNPIGLVNGTGYFGEMTRKFINSL